MSVDQSAPEAQFYTVVSGDTLSKISKQFYGDANKYKQIFEANKPMLKSPDKIYPGPEPSHPAGMIEVPSRGGRRADPGAGRSFALSRARPR